MALRLTSKQAGATDSVLFCVFYMYTVLTMPHQAKSARCLSEFLEFFARKRCTVLSQLKPAPSVCLHVCISADKGQVPARCAYCNPFLQLLCPGAVCTACHSA